MLVLFFFLCYCRLCRAIDVIFTSISIFLAWIVWHSLFKNLLKQSWQEQCYKLSPLIKEAENVSVFHRTVFRSIVLFRHHSIVRKTVPFFSMIRSEVRNACLNLHTGSDRSIVHLLATLRRLYLHQLQYD